ncbi:phytochrome E isoform X3 [Syzygium oleosum]|uniref:phytochrome E isoform X3 n=1 Tax=Syzygium oleosum TaxID=219896 RepID=UPI0024B89358|nr:phytochrome E isoform X3 [Syzygium oleosum]
MALRGDQKKHNVTTLVSSAGSDTMRQSNSRDKAIAHYNADAVLMAEFEQSSVSGKSFDYTKSVMGVPQFAPEEKITAYLSRIQRGGLTQPFGCMLAVEEPGFRIIGYSENCFHLLGIRLESEFLGSRSEKGLIGVDARTLFTPSSGASLAKAAASREISLLNPVWVYSRGTQKPYYAILHRIDVGIVIDLEPARSGDPAMSLAGAVQSQKLAVRALSRLQSLPGGDTGLLCDTVVEDVQKLTGYDRVMVYKFHDDDHGEVISEIRRSDLEPYLGLHYPATDIPQAARFLFKQNRVRMICDCNADPVKVVQSEELKQPLCLVNSTIRSPHGCHTQYMANMGSVASLVMAVIVNSGDSMKLWGLVVCHHTSPRYVPFPLRYACEFLMQAFGLQLHMELQLGSQLAEKKILRTQTLLCDMLLRDAPLGIITQSPSVMDLVKCDGAALYYGGNCWLLGVTPSEAQVKDLAEWLLTNHGDSTGLSTDSLADADYPGAASLGDAVCGMATARITSRDILFWFRSHTANEMKWGGAKHHPEDKDDGGRMHPRSSFKAFLEVVKCKSLPWEVSEINAIHSLQLIMRDSFLDINVRGPKSLTSAGRTDTKMHEIDELSSVACEMVRLIETATAPIFGVDSAGLINGWNAKMAELTGLPTNEAIGKSLINEFIHEDSRGTLENVLCRALQDDNGCCSEWNAAMEKLTGWMRHEVIGKTLPGEIFGGYCRLKGQETLTKFMILLYQGISGQDTENFPFGFFDRKRKFVEVSLTASRRTNTGGNIVGCFCFLQIITPDAQLIPEGQGQEDAQCALKLKELAYVRREMKNALNGIRFTHKLLENTAISDNQKQVLNTSDACERQIMTIIEDMDFGSLHDGRVDLNMEEFLLGSVLDTVISQVMIPLRERNLQLFHEIPEEMKNLSLFGDQVRLQLVLSDFLLNVVHHASSPDGWVEIKILPGLKLIQDGSEFVRIQIRMIHAGQGLPSALIDDMFDGENQWGTSTREGLGLNLSRKLLNKMNGQVHYIRESKRCYFVIDLDLKTQRERHKML